MPGIESRIQNIVLASWQLPVHTHAHAVQMLAYLVHAVIQKTLHQQMYVNSSVSYRVKFTFKIADISVLTMHALCIWSDEESFLTAHCCKSSSFRTMWPNNLDKPTLVSIKDPTNLRWIDVFSYREKVPKKPHDRNNFRNLRSSDQLRIVSTKSRLYGANI